MIDGQPPQDGGAGAPWLQATSGAAAHSEGVRSMALGLKQNSVSPIGIDFGAGQLKLLQMTAEEPAPRLLATAARAIPDNHPHPDDFLVEALRHLISRGGFSGRRVIAAIPASLTFVEHVRVAHGPGGAAASNNGHVAEIQRQIAAKLNVDPGRLVLRHISVGDVMDDGATRHEYIGMAISRGSVLHYINLLKQAKLDAVGLYCEPQAILQAFAHRFRRSGDDKLTTFFVDIGAASTKTMITHGNELKFSKLISVGGRHFDLAYAQELSIDLAEARQRRRRQAQESAAAAAEASEAPLTPMDGGATSTALMEAPDQPSHEMIPAGGEMLDCLIDELQLCAGYHGSIFPDRAIDKIVFLGGEANHALLCRRIAQTLGLPGELGDPLSHFSRAETAMPPIDVDLRQPTPGWAVPLGLCRLPANL